MVELYRAERFFANPAHPIFVYPFNDRRPVQPYHYHEFDELVVVTHGSAIHDTEYDSYPISVGDVFFLHAAQTHGFREQQQFAVINLLFRPAALELPWNRLRSLPGSQALYPDDTSDWHGDASARRLQVNGDQLAWMLALLQNMTMELSKRDLGYEAVTLAQFSQLFVFLARCYARMLSLQSHDAPRITDAITLIERRYTEPLRLDHLADAACMSISTFTRAFKQATGYAPIAYLLHLRIHKAAALLSETPLTITQIALQVGFDDSNYFTRQFTAIMGISPRKYQLLTRQVGIVPIME